MRSACLRLIHETMTHHDNGQEIEGDMGGHRVTVHCAWPCLLVAIMPLVFLNTTTI